MSKANATQPHTIFVGLKDFRSDVAKYAKQATEGTHKVIMTSRNKPLFMLTPLDDVAYTEGG